MGRNPESQNPKEPKFLKAKIPKCRIPNESKFEIQNPELIKIRKVKIPKSQNCESQSPEKPKSRMNQYLKKLKS